MENEMLMKYVIDYISPVIYEEIGIDSNDLHFSNEVINNILKMQEELEVHSE